MWCECNSRVLLCLLVISWLRFMASCLRWVKWCCSLHSLAAIYCVCLHALEFTHFPNSWGVLKEHDGALPTTGLPGTLADNKVQPRTFMAGLLLQLRVFTLLFLWILHFLQFANISCTIKITYYTFKMRPQARFGPQAAVCWLTLD